MIRLTSVDVRFGDVHALRLERLEIEEGSRHGVVGPNGSGKSTLLRVLASLLAPSAGRAEGLLPPGRAVLVHQRPYLFRGTARQNVAFALRLHGRSPREATDLLDRLGARHLGDRSANDLSAGERRRVAIARALAVRPRLLLLDEPLTALDEDGRDRAVEAMRSFAGTLVIAAPALSEEPVDHVLELRAPG